MTIVAALLIVQATAAPAPQDQAVAGWALTYKAPVDGGDPTFAMTRTTGPIIVTYRRGPGSPNIAVKSPKCVPFGWSAESDLRIDDETPQPLAVQAHAFAAAALVRMVVDCADEKHDAAAALTGFDEAATTLDGWAAPNDGQGQ